MCIINENKIDVQPSEQLKVYKSVVPWSRYYYMRNTQGNEYPNFSLRITEEKSNF